MDLGILIRQLQGSSETPSLTNAWATQSTYTPLTVKRMGRLVVLFGTLNGTSASAVSAATLSEAYWPPTTVRAPNSYYTGAAYALGQTVVTTAGVVQVYGNAGALTTRDFYAIQAVWRV